MFKILSGPMLNALGRGKAYGATPSGPVELGDASADAAYPPANVYDGVPARPLKLSGPTTGFNLRLSNNLVVNGDMEQGTTGWAGIGATITSETGAGNYHKGVKGLKIVATGAFGYATPLASIEVPVDESLQVWAAAKSDGTNQTRLCILCPQTGKYLNAAGAWVSGFTGCMAKTGASMAAFSPVAFTAPTFAEVGKPTAALVLQLMNDVNGATSYWDEVLLVPGVNFVGVFGHNLGAATMRLDNYDANYWHSPVYGGTLITATPLVSPSAHGLTGGLSYFPFLSVALHAGPSYGSVYTATPPVLGEIVVGQAFDLLSNPDYPVAVEFREPNLRYQSSAGTQWVLPRGGRGLRRVTLSFAYVSEAEYVQARDRLYGASRGGAYPIVLIPTETDAGEVIFGRLEDSTTFRREGFSKRVAEFIVQEEAFPWVV